MKMWRREHSIGKVLVASLAFSCRCFTSPHVESTRARLRRFDEAKAVAATHNPSSSSVGPQEEYGIDLQRAVCFLEQRDAFQARQALAEELRHSPSNADARAMYLRIDKALASAIDPPAEVRDMEPVFGMLFDALKGHSMLTWPRLFSLYMHAKHIVEEHVDGDIVECGCAGGGSVVLLGAVIRFVEGTRGLVSKRCIFACDTFSGMPPPTPSDVLASDKTAASLTSWSTGTCSGSEAHVRALAKAFDVNIITVPGLFQDTLMSLQTRQIALLHVDADWYDSTKAVLSTLFPRVNPRGGIVQIDDYRYWDGCRKATDEVLGPHRIQRLQDIDGNAVFLALD